MNNGYENERNCELITKNFRHHISTSTELYLIRWQLKVIYTPEFCFMKTRISNRSDFVLLLLACMMSVAVLNTRSIDPDEAGTQNICLAISAKVGNLPAFFPSISKQRLARVTIFYSKGLRFHKNSTLTHWCTCETLPEPSMNRLVDFYYLMN